MEALIWIFASTAVSLLFAALILHILHWFGPAGGRLAAWLAQAPGLDLAVGYFTVLPMLTGFVCGWIWVGGPLGALTGLLSAVVGQVAAVLIWTPCHEIIHFRAWRGPRIVKVLNKKVGRWRNHAAVWWTALAVPVFWLIRVAEYIVYPPLTKLIGLPRYNHKDWVNISRHKFEGLVGHDLLWCLYCDWMTGVWSLGSEMLRNVESFWCPIRFRSDKKCENCAVDFPDINGGWVRADGSMKEVADLLNDKLKDGEHSWYGHPARLTINGHDIEPAPGRPDDDATTITEPN